MTTAMISEASRQLSPMPPLLRRRFGNREWDAALRATAVAGLLAIPLVLLVPSAEPLILLVLSTVWMRGPASAFLPVGLEPVLMLYGRLYGPWVTTGVALVASAYAEVISLHLMRGVMALRMLDRLRGTVQGSRVLRLFARRPGLAVALAAVSPIPDWITRTLAAVSRYPAARYVVADTIGRAPKLFAAAALGSLVPLSGAALAACAATSVALALAIAVWRWRRVRQRD